MGRKPVNETLREVRPNLWVSDQESAAVLGDDYDLVIDCTGRGPTRGNGHTVSLLPSGRTNHSWAPDQLNTIVFLATVRLERGESILIHCRRGVSRSACAAAAVLLWLEEAKDAKDALSKVAFGDQRMSGHSTASLKRWWKAEEEAAQPALFDA